MDSRNGVASTPAEKRQAIMWLGLKVHRLQVVHKDLLRRLLGLMVHPLTHCRCLMAALHRTYQRLSSIPEGTSVGWKGAAGARDEILSALLLLPVACARLRWGESQTLFLALMQLLLLPRFGNSTVRAEALPGFRYGRSRSTIPRRLTLETGTRQKKAVSPAHPRPLVDHY